MTDKLDRLLQKETDRLAGEKRTADAEAERKREVANEKEAAAQRALVAAAKNYIDRFYATGIKKYGFSIESIISPFGALMSVYFRGIKLKHYGGSNYFKVNSYEDCIIEIETTSSNRERQWKGIKDHFESRYLSPEELAEGLVKELAKNKVSGAEVGLPS
jgi:hypothetical protein